MLEQDNHEANGDAAQTIGGSPAIGPLTTALEGARGFNESVAQALADIEIELNKVVDRLKSESGIANKKLGSVDI